MVSTSFVFFLFMTAMTKESGMQGKGDLQDMDSPQGKADWEQWERKGTDIQSAIKGITETEKKDNKRGNTERRRK